jgi:plastocyanin
MFFRHLVRNLARQSLRPLSYQGQEYFPWLTVTALLSGAILMTAPPTMISFAEKGHCVHCPEDFDEEEEEGKKDRDKKSKVLSFSPDEDEEDHLPSYVPKHFKEDVGTALDHKARISEDSKFGLASESVYPIVKAHLTLAPDVPPPIKRNHPVHLVVDMVTTNKKMNVIGNTKYEYWPFGFYDQRERKNKYGIPGPFIRARVGDVLQVNFTNLDESGMAHSIDFHAVCGPGGGSPTTFAEQDETKVGAYLLSRPGLYIYHCAAAPIPVHIHNGMFGLILVEPAEGLPEVDREIYIVQHEL